MNYNTFSTSELVVLEDECNSRAKLDTGTHCNYACGFCYYLDKLDQITPLDIIKKRAKKIRSFGIEEIDLSGGESSIHRDWFEILQYCRELGFKNISALTNGHKFSNEKFVERSVENGLNELLFSLHGWNEEGHDKIVKRDGAFQKILKSIENSKKHGVLVRINCTVTSYNAPHLGEYVKLINEIHPKQINFLPLNYWENANELKAESYEYLSGYIKEAISAINDKIEVNVRYIPFCFMEGFERHVVGVFQHIFDKSDWNLITYDVEEFDVKNVTINEYYQKAALNRNYTYHKDKKCFDCKHFFICDGVEKKISKTQAVYPQLGEKIKDILFYRRENISHREKNE